MVIFCGTTRFDGGNSTSKKNRAQILFARSTVTVRSESRFCKIRVRQKNKNAVFAKNPELGFFCGTPFTMLAKCGVDVGGGVNLSILAMSYFLIFRRSVPNPFPRERASFLK